MLDGLSYVLVVYLAGNILVIDVVCIISVMSRPQVYQGMCDRMGLTTKLGHHRYDCRLWYSCPDDPQSSDLE